MKIVKESLLFEADQERIKIPEIMYHGSFYKFDLKSLQMNRDSLNIYQNTGSSRSGYGFYLTKDLWASHNLPEHRDKRIIQPLYDEGSFGNESAEKYARTSFISRGKTSYIYAVRLMPNVNIKEHGKYNIWNLSKNEAHKLINEGINGLYSRGVNGDIEEIVILSKDIIKSLDIKYYADETMLLVSLRNYKSDKIINEKIIPHKFLDRILEKALGKGYQKVGPEYYSKEIDLDTLTTENADPKLNYVLVENNGWPADWKKIK